MNRTRCFVIAGLVLCFVGTLCAYKASHSFKKIKTALDNSYSTRDYEPDYGDSTVQKVDYDDYEYADTLGGCDDTLGGYDDEDYVVEVVDSVDHSYVYGRINYAEFDDEDLEVLQDLASEKGRSATELKSRYKSFMNVRAYGKALEVLDVFEQMSKSGDAACPYSLDEIKKLRGRLYENRGDMVSAYQFASEEIAANPTSIDGYVTRILTSFLMNNYDAAYDDVVRAEALCTTDKERKDMDFVKGLVLTKMGRTDEAAALANKLLDNGVANYDRDNINLGMMMLFLASVEAGQVDDAIDMILGMPDEFANGFAELLHAYSVDGELLLRTLVDKIEKSGESYDSRLYSSVGALAAYQGDWDTAVKYLEKGGNWNYYNLFNIYLNMGDWDNAMKYAKILDGWYEDMPGYCIYEAMVELMGNAPVKAEMMMENHFGMFQNEYESTCFVGNIFLLEGDCEMAIEVFRGSFYNSSWIYGAPRIFLGIADAYKELGDREEAEKHYRMAEVCGDNKMSKEIRVAALAELGRTEEAYALLDNLLEDKDIVTPELSRYFNIARLYGRLGDVDNALKYLEMSLQHGLGQPAWHWIMVNALELNEVRQDPRYSELESNYIDQ